MADKQQRRGNREMRKPKAAKAKPAPPASPFLVVKGKLGGGASAAKK